METDPRDRLYADVLYELSAYMREAHPTIDGFAVTLRKVGAAHGIHEPMYRFFLELLRGLGDHSGARGSTVPGLGAVFKRVGLDLGVSKADALPLPRYSRSEQRERPVARPRSDRW